VIALSVRAIHCLLAFTICSVLLCNHQELEGLQGAGLKFESNLERS